MGLYELALVFSIIVVLYNIQQIKIALKKKGYPVDMITGWLRDYRQFKELINDEPDEKIRISFQKNLNGLHFSILGVLIFAVLVVRKLM